MSLRHTKHYFRIGFLILGGLLSFLVLRALLIPPSFGQYGHFRGANVQQQMDKKTVFSAKEACADCHSDIWTTHKEGSHATVQCQNCHDALPVHFDLEKGEFVGPMPIQRTSALCLKCHLDLPSRPEGFPTINPKEHLKDDLKAQDPAVCLTCHVPHSPKIEK
ncbi:MAG: hypothetical protein Q7T11_08010 [Deltaproteobacteria bacterium]|nr:hypothetical protein [Deltaproteobacteria bacterium]